MKRFITYLYLYDNSEKKYNAGFARMEIRADITRMELHIKAPALYDTQSLVYLFARKGEIIHAVPVSQLTFVKGMGDCRIQIGNTAVGGSPYEISDMKGILIENKDQTRFISQWDEEETRVENIRIYHQDEKKYKDIQESYDVLQSVDAKQREKELQKKSEEHTEQVEHIEHIDTRIQPKMQQPKPHLIEEAQQPQPALHTAEIPMPRIIHGNFPREESLSEHYDKIRAQAAQDSWITGGDLEGVKIELKDIRELPKQYWSLGNNSFLLHGFFNYRYLVFGKRIINDKEVMFLGVPGVYQNQERVMAGIFGFPEFVIAQEPGQEVADLAASRITGFWCHPMDE